MRNKLFTLALGGMLALGASSALSAQDATTAPQQGQYGQHRGMDPDRQLEHMTKQLDLTADQQSQIKPILVDRQQKMQALWQDQSVSQQDRRSKMMAIRDDAKTKIEAVLNDQQKTKFESMQEHMRGGHGGDNGSAQPQ